MATTNRQDLLDLIKTLVEQPQGFSFYQAVRVLECAAAGKHPRVGRSRDPADDFVRFGQYVDLVHLATDLRVCTPTGDDPEDPVYKLKACFTGLSGPFGPMPEWMTETLVHLSHGIPDEVLFQSAQGAGLYASSAVKDEGMAEFLDLFHHRMFSFLYRAWSSGNMPVAFDRVDTGGIRHEGDAPRFGHFIASTFGAGSDELFEHPDLPPLSRLAFAGHLSCQTRHAEGLASILTGFFHVPVEIRQFVGHWLTIPEDCQCRLGQTGVLGESIFVGRRMWDHQQKFRVRLGPMKLARLKEFLPDGPAYPQLAAWVDFYTSRQWLCDFQIILEKEEVPSTVLGKAGQLGRTSWLKSREFAADCEDLVLQHAN
ncbi:type VI secretion system baseplate subunit TssG [Luteolibacter sp. Populi]|uniref:type VI secretion system baseplate subunit TssG n=1 Tax=Luteolibacter sp. Populi TaxID=3230487 RepID=UPI0034670ADA